MANRPAKRRRAAQFCDTVRTVCDYTFISCLLATVASLALGDSAKAACERGRFKVEGAYAMDRRTSLTWQHCALGSEWRNGECQGEQQALSLSEATAKAASQGNGWRLPTAEELADLIDASCGKPAIDSRVFPNLVDDGEGAIPYWSSTRGGMPGLMTFVDFANARIDWHSPGFPLFVCLVRSPR
jgi:hypothetical protein